MSDFNISSIILAAGEGSRMGKIKQLLPWKNSNLLKHVINQSKNSKVSNTIVVLGAYSDKIMPTIYDIPLINIVENKDWENGMMSSITKGISSCNIGSDAVLILLADQPAITADYINLMIDNYILNKDTHNIVATQYIDNIGVPALFDKSYFPAFKNSYIAEGANYIIKTNMDMVKIIEPSFELFDLDTNADYKYYSNIN